MKHLVIIFSFVLLFAGCKDDEPQEQVNYKIDDHFYLFDAEVSANLIVDSNGNPVQIKISAASEMNRINNFTLYIKDNYSSFAGGFIGTFNGDLDTCNPEACYEDDFVNFYVDIQRFDDVGGYIEGKFHGKVIDVVYKREYILEEGRFYVRRGDDIVEDNTN